MLSVIDERGRRSPVSNRVPSAQHWDIYRRAVRERLDLIESMSHEIRDVVGRNLERGERAQNSTWMGSEILGSWEHTAEWSAFCGGSEDQSSALFGEIMWTVMYDDEREWCTVKTTEANVGREERVYFPAPAED